MDLSRRTVLAGVFASAASSAWAELGGARLLAAARLPDGRFALIGLDAKAREAFRAPLPARGHAAVAHPAEALAVVFARRPGVFAMVVDCTAGREVMRLRAPHGRHFYGHGAFSADGALLFTTENDYAAGEGRVGVWDARAGFKRIGEFSSAGAGPHDALLSRDGATLIIANGGLTTHPDSGRAKLNLPAMRPNIAWIDTKSGEPVSIVEPDEPRRMNSLRHLAHAPGGGVVIGAQWQGDPAAAPSLVALAGADRPLVWADGDPHIWRRMQGYIGSVAADGDGTIVATGPRGGLAVVISNGSVGRATALKDVCGAAPVAGGGLTLTTGHGGVHSASGALIARHRLAFDNHLAALT